MPLSRWLDQVDRLYCHTCGQGGDARGNSPMPDDWERFDDGAILCYDCAKERHDREHAEDKLRRFAAWATLEAYFP